METAAVEVMKSAGWSTGKDDPFNIDQRDQGLGSLVIATEETFFCKVDAHSFMPDTIKVR